MSAFEVLQSCSIQWKALLKAIGGIDPTDTNLIIFDLEDHIQRLPQSLRLFTPEPWDYFLYLRASDYTITMVLIQEDYSHDEHVIYYLSRSLTTIETKYLHVEKLALAAIQYVQCF